MKLLRQLDRVAAALLGAPLLLFGVAKVGAVEAGKPSKTSVLVMAARAIGARDPDPTVRNPDWLAEHLLGPEERALIPDNYALLALDQDYREAMKDPRTRGLVLTMTVRTKFNDEHLLQAVGEGALQVVNLGAGFDSRAYRFRQALRNVKVFEVDYGPTQEYKRHRVQEVLGPPPPNVRYVPIDFTREQLADVLGRAGYRTDLRTFFLWEGVTQYIPEEAVLETLRFVAGNSASGSAVVFDYSTRSRLEELPKVSEAERTLQAMVRAWGEPWIFGIPEGTTASFVKNAGLDLVENLPVHGPESVTRYLTRKDRSRMGDLPWPLPSPELGEGRYTYYCARATVRVREGSQSR
ncbi:MAG TPA: SAM-dependent methyltransferase [Vicinamibacteria bacterium]|nr:SAM-dependent methyltransferase [Vicinamibacteria bacterium]